MIFNMPCLIVIVLEILFCRCAVWSFRERTLDVDFFFGASFSYVFLIAPCVFVNLARENSRLL